MTTETHTMNAIALNDLELNTELDNSALSSILGGYLAVTLVPSLLLCIFSYLVDPTAAGLELLLLTPLRLVVAPTVTAIGAPVVTSQNGKHTMLS